MTTAALLGDDSLALLARYGFVEDDTERLLAHTSSRTANGIEQGEITRSKGYLITIDGRLVVVSGMFYASPRGGQGFTTAAWVEQDRLHRATCTTSTDEAASRAAMLDFLARR